MTNILNKKIILHNSAVTSLKNQTLLIEKVIKTMHKHVNLGGKLLLCGNGGSAADLSILQQNF